MFLLSDNFLHKQNREDSWKSPIYGVCSCKSLIDLYVIEGLRIVAILSSCIFYIIKEKILDYLGWYIVIFLWNSFVWNKVLDQKSVIVVDQLLYVGDIGLWILFTKGYLIV